MSYDVDDFGANFTRTSTGFSVSDTKGRTVSVVGQGMGYAADGDWVTGVASSISMTDNGQLILDVTGLSVDATSNAYDTGYGGEAPGMQAELAYWMRSSDTIIGASGNEYLKSFAGNDTIEGGAGNDTIDGGTGTDTSIYSGNASSYQVTKTSTGYTVSGGTEGTDTLLNVERLKFADKTIALDISGNAGQAYRLYQAAFDRTPDVSGLSFQAKGMDAGWGLVSIAQNFIDSPEFSSKYGALNNTQFVSQLYANVLHRAADSGGLSYHVTNLEKGMSRAQVLVGFSESPENQAAIIGVIQNGIELV
ncbi:DUF4214 domain-containing protein [Noviherbaspirillum sp. ST9]|uniref:DUF4214 domain-containing protein n=1 Tax=Noviherbaspirillum sp. ST9 TaxID=3401606 RepID=UPI003B589700